MSVCHEGIRQEGTRTRTSQPTTSPRTSRRSSRQEALEMTTTTSTSTTKTSSQSSTPTSAILGHPLPGRQRPQASPRRCAPTSATSPANTDTSSYPTTSPRTSPEKKHLSELWPSCGTATKTSLKQDDDGNLRSAPAPNYCNNFPNYNIMMDALPQAWNTSSSHNIYDTSNSAVRLTPSSPPRRSSWTSTIKSSSVGYDIINFQRTRTSSIHDFLDFVNQHWRQHTDAMYKQPRLRKRDVKQIFSIIPHDYIIHNEDHANAHHLMVYCPNVYNQAAYNTWFDRDTFVVMNGYEATVKQNMQKSLPLHIAKKFKKILDFTKPFPYGYIMMKRKKQWNKGRTIVAYANTGIGPLLKLFAIALQHMLNTTWPLHFGSLTTPLLWRGIHQFFAVNRRETTAHETPSSSATTSSASSSQFPKRTSSAASLTSFRSIRRSTATTCTLTSTM